MEIFGFFGKLEPEPQAASPAFLFKYPIPDKLEFAIEGIDNKNSSFSFILGTSRNKRLVTLHDEHGEFLAELKWPSDETKSRFFKLLGRIQSNEESKEGVKGVRQ